MSTDRRGFFGRLGAFIAMGGQRWTPLDSAIDSTCVSLGAPTVFSSTRAHDSWAILSTSVMLSTSSMSLVVGTDSETRGTNHNKLWTWTEQHSATGQVKIMVGPKPEHGTPY